MIPEEKQLRDDLNKMLIEARVEVVKSRKRLIKVESLIQTAGFKINKYTGRINKKNNKTT